MHHNEMLKIVKDHSEAINSCMQDTAKIIIDFYDSKDVMDTAEKTCLRLQKQTDYYVSLGIELSTMYQTLKEAKDKGEEWKK